MRTINTPTPPALIKQRAISPPPPPFVNLLLFFVNLHSFLSKQRAMNMYHRILSTAHSSAALNIRVLAA